MVVVRKELLIKVGCEVVCNTHRFRSLINVNLLLASMTGVQVVVRDQNFPIPSIVIMFFSLMYHGFSDEIF